jgi:DNA-binding response OmpR family regulator
MITGVDRPHILIADDTPSHLKLMEALLGAEPYLVTAAEDGEEVLEHLQRHTPDLLVLDVDMPFLSGLDVCGRARGVKRLASVPVLLVSAQPFARVEHQMEWVQADAFLEKPLRMDSFRAKIRELWEVRKAA